jgi:demethylmenaquinone methyltransferase/2-methoxy-6-polyprenyl-1,4-benzoquinol methylase
MYMEKNDNLPGKENKEGYVRDLFNTIAARYDLLNTLITLGLDGTWRRFAVKRTKIGPGSRVLDICCGTGKITLELARRVGATGHVTGLDFSEKMLDVARQSVAASGLADRITLVQGNAMNLPFADDSFHAVTVGWGLRNVPDIYTVILEMQRVVIPGGMVVSLDMGKPEMTGFKELYWLYVEKVVPLMGKIWAREYAYNYLHNSAKAFLHQKELAMLFQKAGLTEAAYHNLCGGVVAVVEGKKPGGAKK